MNALVRPGLSDRRAAAFPRSARLLLSRDFKRVFDNGRSVVGRGMVVWYAPGGTPKLRVGVVASKRTFRRAVDRNRAKRLLREAFRLNNAVFIGCQDLVIIARRRILGMSRQDVEREFVYLLRKASIPMIEELQEPGPPSKGSQP